MSCECISTLNSLVESIVAPVSIILNLLLIVLILTSTPKELRDYSRLLLSISVVELAFTASSYLLEMVEKPLVRGSHFPSL